MRRITHEIKVRCTKKSYKATLKQISEQHT